MANIRKVIIGAGTLLGTAALTLTAPAAGMAATTTTHRGVVPSATAPHAGHVARVRTGDAVTVNNPASVHAFQTLHDDLRATANGATVLPDPPGYDGVTTIHKNVGTSFSASTVGAQATHSVSLTLKPARPGTTLYMPTIYPSGGSCIEMTTAYFHDEQVVAAWDWCRAITFVAEVSIDKAFKKTYTKHKNYSVQILQTDEATNAWTSYLYNYKTGTWEEFFTQNGTSQVGLDKGWDIYELYTDIQGDGTSYACTDLKRKRVEAKKIMVGVDGTLVRADASHAGDDYDVPLDEFQCRQLTYKMKRDFDHWKARG